MMLYITIHRLLALETGFRNINKKERFYAVFSLIFSAPVELKKHYSTAAIFGKTAAGSCVSRNCKKLFLQAANGEFNRLFTICFKN